MCLQHMLKDRVQFPLHMATQLLQLRLLKGLFLMRVHGTIVKSQPAVMLDLIPGFLLCNISLFDCFFYASTMLFGSLLFCGIFWSEIVQASIFLFAQDWLEYLGYLLFYINFRIFSIFDILTEITESMYYFGWHVHFDSI